MSSDTSTLHGTEGRRPARPARVARGATLDGFVAEATTGPGVALRDLTPLTSLIVHTRNSRYHIVVSQGDEILVQGGSFFPDPTPARLDGSSLGQSLLKLGWIGVGLRMEIRAGAQRIVTTTVRSIARGGDGDPSRPH
jgi:hypothetical protein